MLNPQAPADSRRSRLKGRAQRTQSVGTKLTVQEETEAVAAAEDAGRVLSEWLRELIMRELRTPFGPEALLAEILGVRLLLVNVLRPFLAGQKLSTEGFDKLLDDIGTTKYELAAKLIAERRR